MGPIRVANATDVFGSLTLAPLDPNGSAGRSGAQPLWLVHDDSERNAFIPVDEVFVVATPESGDPSLASAPSAVEIRLSALLEGPEGRVLRRGGQLIFLNDLSEARQIRPTLTRELVVLDPGQRIAVFDEAVAAPGPLIIEAQEADWRAYVVVVEPPFLAARPRYRGEGRFSLSFGDYPDGTRLADTFSVSVWFRGRLIRRETVVAHRREERIGLSTVELTRDQFIGPARAGAQ